MNIVRAAIAAICASGTLMAIFAMGNGLDVGLVLAPIASPIAFGASLIVQRWRWGGVIGQQLATIAAILTFIASAIALILNRGVIGPQDIASGLGLLAIGGYAAWPALAGGVLTYMLLDYRVSRRA